MTAPIITVRVRFEHDLVLARQRTRLIAELAGLDHQDQSRLATAVSEVVRNAYQYAGGGRVEFALEEQAIPQLVVRVVDEGQGIPNLQQVLDGHYVSGTGLGRGLVGARRLTDSFQVTSTEQGTEVRLGKRLPRATGPLEELAMSISRRLAEQAAGDALSELREQNQELLRVLEDSRQRSAEIERLNRELAETNRGVLALYTELDEKAGELARASELKTRFLSNISHELRTPLNAILNITRMLIDRMDGPLSEEQERQVAFIRHAALDLSRIVADLLDIARIEAGKTLVTPAQTRVSHMIAALRGMFRSLHTGSRVQLIFDDMDDLTLYTDEGKVSQILRNLIANALKFTPAGEVRVSMARPDPSTVVFTVSDTGIGIPPEQHQRIFEEFAQVDNTLQSQAGGAGLGLALSRRLATLLGGHITLDSAVGVGSTFHLALPVVYQNPEEAEAEPVADRGVAHAV